VKNRLRYREFFENIPKHNFLVRAFGIAISCNTMVESSSTPIFCSSDIFAPAEFWCYTSVVATRFRTESKLEPNLNPNLNSGSSKGWVHTPECPALYFTGMLVKHTEKSESWYRTVECTSAFMTLPSSLLVWKCFKKGIFTLMLVKHHLCLKRKSLKDTLLCQQRPLGQLDHVHTRHNSSHP
jgi:hypothetical protein